MTDDKDEKTWSDLRDALLAMALTLPFRAYVMLTIWEWFVVPLGVPAIGFWHAMGLWVLGHVISGKGGGKPPKDGVWTIVGRYVPFTLMMWGIAALAHVWMGL